MTDAEKKSLIDTYHQRKTGRKLSDNLANPSPGRLKAECRIVYEEKGSPKKDDTLRFFFERNGFDDGYKQIIDDMDIDKFRPLEYLLKGRVENPNDKHYRMLEWLMGTVEEKPNKHSQETEGEERVRLIWKISGGLMAIFLAGFVYWQDTKQCMYWTGDHYVISSCSVKRGDTAIIGLDEKKVTYLKRINRPDTITYAAIGHVWYIKINNKIEYYTAAGFHPIDGRRRLKPITIYMIDKYILKKAT